MNENLVRQAKEIGFESEFLYEKAYKHSPKENLRWLFWMTELHNWMIVTHKFYIYVCTTPVFDTTQGSKYKATVDVPFQPFKWTTGRYYLGNSYAEALEKGLYQAVQLVKLKTAK